MNMKPMKPYIVIVIVSTLLGGLTGFGLIKLFETKDNTPTERPPDVESPQRSIESYSDRVAELNRIYWEVDSEIERIRRTRQIIAWEGRIALAEYYEVQVLILTQIKEWQDVK